MISADALLRPTLDTIAAAYAAVVIERQVQLASAVELAEWSADLDRRILSLGDRELTVSLLGSSTDATATWQWAWDSPTYGPDHRAVAATAPLVAIGRQYDVPELATGQIRLSGVYDGGQGPAHTLALASCGLLAGNAYFPAAYDGGTAWLLITDDRLPAPRPAGGDALRVISAAASMFPHDNRLTVETYLAVHDLSASDDAERITASFPDGEATFTFDELDRLIDVSASF